MKQIVAHKKLSTLQGIGLIVGLIATLLLLNLSFSLIAPYIGSNPASLCFWIAGGVIAFFMMRIYIAAYCYELSEDVLRISRKYGRRERFIEDIYLNKLVYIGALEEAEKRHAGAKKLRAVHKSVSLPVTAVAYSAPDGMHIAYLQLDDAIRGRMIERIRGK